jgi:tubulin-specific chaperone B
VCELSDDSKMLGFYSVESGNEIHVIDTDPFSLSRAGGLTDTSLVEKYRMSEEAYDQRKGTLREYIKEQRAKDPNFKLKASSNPFPGKPGAPGNDAAPPADAGPETVAGITVGARCQVMPGKRRGCVMYVGEVPEIKGGHWVSTFHVHSVSMMFVCALYDVLLL